MHARARARAHTHTHHGHLGACGFGRRFVRPSLWGEWLRPRRTSRWRVSQPCSAANSSARSISRVASPRLPIAVTATKARAQRQRVRRAPAEAVVHRDVGDVGEAEVVGGRDGASRAGSDLKLASGEIEEGEADVDKAWTSVSDIFMAANNVWRGDYRQPRQSTFRWPGEGTRTPRPDA